MANKMVRTGKGNKADDPIILRQVIEVLSMKGYAKTSMTDLTRATGVHRSALHDAFGTREEILRAAIRYCADTEASLAHEPLRVSATGRDAIRLMLEEHIRLRRHRPRYSGCLFTVNAFCIPSDDTALQDFLLERRRTLSDEIRSRFARSVGEGELPEQTNCEALANLCLTVLSGITCRIVDGTPPKLIFRSIEFFVNSLGFARRPSPTESSVKRSGIQARRPRRH